MIVCYCKLGKLEEAKSCFDRLIKLNFTPRVDACNALIKGFSVQDRFLEAYDCFCEISEASNIVLHFACYNRLVDGLSHRESLDEGLHVFDVMIEQEVLPTINVCKSLIIGFCKWGRVEEAEILSTEIKSHGFVVDKYMYTYLINSYCKGRKMKMAMRLFLRMLKMGCEPDSYTYTTLIHGFINLGLFSKGWVLHNEMVKSGLKPNLVTYQIMLNKCCRDQKVDCALELLNDMLQYGIAPNAHCYTVVLAALCKQQKFKEVYSLYHKMLDSGIVPDHVLFFVLVKNHPEGDGLYFALTVLQAIAKESCNVNISTPSLSTRPKSMRDAMVEIEYLLEEIVRSNSGLADMAFSIYIIALCMTGQLDSALQCMEKMVNLRLLPLPTAFNSLIKLLTQKGLVESSESYELLNLMQREGVQPNQVTFTILIDGHIQFGELDQAGELFNKMSANGFAPDRLLFNTLIRGFCKVGRPHCLSHMMQKRGFLPSKSSYEKLLSSLCAYDSSAHALKISEDMLSHNYFPCHYNLHQLNSILCKDNRLDEARAMCDMLLNRRNFQKSVGAY